MFKPAFFVLFGFTDCEQSTDRIFASPNQIDTGQDTGDTAETCATCGFDLEGAAWSYTGSIPGEAEAGVGCSDEDDGCQRCFLLEDSEIDLMWRIGDGENWQTVSYGTYMLAAGNEPAYRVNGRYDWLPRAEQGLPAVNTGYVIVTDDQAFTATTLTFGPCG